MSLSSPFSVEEAKVGEAHAVVGQSQYSAPTPDPPQTLLDPEGWGGELPISSQSTWQLRLASDLRREGGRGKLSHWFSWAVRRIFFLEENAAWAALSVTPGSVAGVLGLRSRGPVYRRRVLGPGSPLGR